MNKEIKNIWENAEWTWQARKIIQGLNQFPQEANLFLFIRHSHRKESTDANELEKLGLTELGHEIANKFGKCLPKYRALKIFHSPSPRCRETTQYISEGFYAIGGRYEIFGTNNPINNTKSSKDFVTSQCLRSGGIDFIQRWHDNKFSKNQIIPFHNYCLNVYEFSKRISEKTHENDIILHVTHDIFLIALRYGWFEGSIKYKWPSFLGGFAICFDVGSSFLLDIGKDIPEPIRLCNGKKFPLFTINHKRGGDKYG
jgi:phosphohistidine phosphatase SixA